LIFAKECAILEIRHVAKMAIHAERERKYVIDVHVLFFITGSASIEQVLLNRIFYEKERYSCASSRASTVVTNAAMMAAQGVNLIPEHSLSPI
jgi:hypothetical protein